MIYLSPPDVGPREREALLAAFDSGWIAPIGPQLDAFESALAARVGRRAGAATASGTAALHLALRLLGVGPGDEVWVSTLTFVASVTPIQWLGATPVFVDSDERTWNLDPQLLAEALEKAAGSGRLPKVLIGVDIYGQCADWDAISEICARYGVAVIEDAAEALGAKLNGRAAGSFGALAMVSFNGNKIATCGGGGMLLSDDEEQIQRAKWLGAQAREPAPHYQHVELGYNYRLSNILAGIGLAQLARLDELVAARRENFARYQAGLQELPGVTFMPEPAGFESTRWLSVILLDEAAFGAGPTEARETLAALGIESRPAWKPMHLQPAFEGYTVVGGRVSETVFAKGLCLPSGSNLGAENCEQVMAGLRDLHRKARPRVTRPSTGAQ